MVISLSDGVKISKFGNSARKALLERLDPTSESSTRIAEASDPSMSPTPMNSGDSTPSRLRMEFYEVEGDQGKEMKKCPTKSVSRDRKQGISRRN